MRHDSHYVDELASTTRTIGRSIAVHLIAPNPEQPRREIGDLTELSDSIREKGVLEPLLVKPNPGTGTWMIIAGERRWRASQIAGLTEVPCIEMDLDERGIAEIALIENLQRKDLNVWEEADGLAALSEKFGYTHDEIARKISKSRSTVTELMTIAGLPPDIREKCIQAKIAAKSTLLEIARQFDEHAMFETVERLSTGKSARPKSHRAAVGGNVSSNGSSTPEGLNDTFTYSSKGGDFKLEIRFKEPIEHTPQLILRSLKQAFDEIKNRRS